MNLSNDLSEDKELFSGEQRSKKNTMNLSKESGDKELFYLKFSLIKYNEFIEIK